MHAAKLYMNHATNRVEHALSHMPIATSTSRSLPSSMPQINHYVEELLTPSEQVVCDTATD